MATGFKWEVTPEQAFTELYDEYTRQIYREIQRLATKYAPEIEAYLKREASWMDRTGNLRASLYTEVESSLTEIVLAFDYGLDYGVYLEFKHQGRYAIIAPALDYFAPKFWNDVQALFR
jgi:hypothetical protein